MNEERFEIRERPATTAVLEIVPSGGFKLTFTDRKVPNWLHRTAIYLLLGWRWRLPEPGE